jgi:hypothetical protein
MQKVVGSNPISRSKEKPPLVGRLKVVGIVIGGRGIRERLGLDTGRIEVAIVDREVIEWERVREIDLERSVIVVANEAG